MKNFFSTPARNTTRETRQSTLSQVSIFDQQDGKLVKGTVVQTTDQWFVLQCTDGQIRKFDINCLPMA